MRTDLVLYGEIRPWKMTVLDIKSCYRRTVLKEECLYFITIQGKSSNSFTHIHFKKIWFFLHSVPLSVLAANSNHSCNKHSYLESENLVHFPPKELSNDFTGLVFSYLQSLYFRSNPCILGSILVFSHSISLL